MRIGLLTDIHEDVDHLQIALARFRRAAVDRVVHLGDVFGTGRRIAEAVRLLDEAGAVGVWGNHDFGLCLDPPRSLRERFPRPVLDFFAGLRPRLELGDCLFTHVEPWRDPLDINHLWTHDGPPTAPRKLALSFAAAPQRMLFMGHVHRWSVATPAGPVPWDCHSPIRLDPPGRHLVAVGPVCDGRCGIWDAEANTLTPIDLRDG